jgi:hypothetical protein
LVVSKKDELLNQGLCLLATDIPNGIMGFRGRFPSPFSR